MTKCESFQIIFNEADGQTYSATFDAVIPSNCKGKFVDVKGNLYHMDKWTREPHLQSTLTNVIHNATPNVDLKCRNVSNMPCKDPPNECPRGCGCIVKPDDPFGTSYCEDS